LSNGVFQTTKLMSAEFVVSGSKKRRVEEPEFQRTANATAAGHWGSLQRSQTP